MNTSACFENLPESLLRPPAHAWEGPQPGLHAQADEMRRYYFSQKNGRLESIIQYDGCGAPEIKVRYRFGAGDSISKPRPFEVEQWNGEEYVSYGLVQQDGRVVRSHSLPRVMVNEHGADLAIPVDDNTVFITPAGVVVRLVSQGSWLRQPKAEFLGRVKEFSPLKPFVVKAVGGEHELDVDRRDVVINPYGHVFEFQPRGLTAIGELVVSEMGESSDAAAQTVEVPHDLFTLFFHPEQSPRVVIRDPQFNELLGGPLHTIVGHHSFLHQSVPELVDIHGSTVAEQRLRDVEQAATELGLVFYALRNEKRASFRAVFLKAQHQLEDALWKRVAELERVIGAEQHSVVNPRTLRAWIEQAAQHPHEALIELKRSATPR